MVPEEKILLQQIKNKNRAVFKQLFEMYYPQLVRFAEGFLYDADLSKDVVQNMFIAFWEKTDHIDIHSSVKGYLYQATRYRCLNKIKSLKIKDSKNVLYVEAMINLHRLDGEIDNNCQSWIIEALELLPEKMREIFKMRYLENQKRKQIAAALGITENTVKTQLLRAKKKLREKALQL